MNARHPYNYNPETRVRKSTLRCIARECRSLPRNELTQKRVKGFAQMIVRDLWDSAWTDVSKALPCQNGEYLVASAGGWYELAHYNGTYKQFTRSNTYPGEVLEVKYWSCLPEIPRQIPEESEVEIFSNEEIQ